MAVKNGQDILRIVDELYHDYLNAESNRTQIAIKISEVAYDFLSKQNWKTKTINGIEIDHHMYQDFLGISLITALNECLKTYSGEKALQEGFYKVLYASLKNELSKEVCKFKEDDDTDGIAFHREGTDSDGDAVRKEMRKVKREERNIKEENPYISEAELIDEISRRTNHSVETVTSYLHKKAIPLFRQNGDGEKFCVVDGHTKNPFDIKQETDLSIVEKILRAVQEEFDLQTETLQSKILLNPQKDFSRNKTMLQFYSEWYTYILMDALKNQSFFPTMKETFKKYSIIDMNIVEKFILNPMQEIPTRKSVSDSLGLDRITNEYSRDFMRKIADKHPELKDFYEWQ